MSCFLLKNGKWLALRCVQGMGAEQPIFNRNPSAWPLITHQARLKLGLKFVECVILRKLLNFFEVYMLLLQRLKYEWLSQETIKRIWCGNICEIFNIRLQRLIASFSFPSEEKVMRSSEQPVESSLSFPLQTTIHHKPWSVWTYLPSSCSIVFLS